MKSHDMSWDGFIDCYRIAVAAWWEKIIIFYNMKYKDVGVTSPVTGRFWFGGFCGMLYQIARSWNGSWYTRRMIGQGTGQGHSWMTRVIGHHGECWQQDGMKTWLHDTRIAVEVGIWNSMTWESLASLGTGMASDGNGGEEVNAIG